MDNLITFLLCLQFVSPLVSPSSYLYCCVDLFNRAHIFCDKQQGFCFGFVQFEVASAVQSAIEASPITIGGRQAYVEEKRASSSRGNNRGRFQSGRGNGGYRNDGMRGRGGYGSGRGYGQGNLNNRTEFGNRGGGRSGSSSRGFEDGYQNGGRMNRTGGLTGNAATKAVAPRVSASA